MAEWSERGTAWSAQLEGTRSDSSLRRWIEYWVSTIRSSSTLFIGLVSSKITWLLTVEWRNCFMWQRQTSNIAAIVFWDRYREWIKRANGRITEMLSLEDIVLERSLGQLLRNILLWRFLSTLLKLFQLVDPSSVYPLPRGEDELW
jgi:hypothetical protein